MTGLHMQDKALAHACGVANQDGDILAIEREFENIPGEIAEPFEDSTLLPVEEHQ